MRKAHIKALFIILGVTVLQAADYHVSTKGNDDNHDSRSKPFKTISAAAAIAQPGDTITVHAGVYRKRVNPPRGGESDTKRIVYQAAPGEKVVIKGSEIIKNWEKVQGDTWKVTLPNSFFGNFNPYSDVVGGDWYDQNPKRYAWVMIIGNRSGGKTSVFSLKERFPYILLAILA